MRRINLTPRQFNFFLWPAFAAADSSKGDPEVLVRLSRRIKRVSDEVPLNDNQQQAVKNGIPVFPDRRIDEPVTLDLEEDEHRTLLGIYNGNLGNFSIMAVEDAVELRDVIKNAPNADEEFSVEEYVGPEPTE